MQLLWRRFRNCVDGLTGRDLFFSIDVRCDRRGRRTSLRAVVRLPLRAAGWRIFYVSRTAREYGFPHASVLTATAP
jgi:hypothetical protein